MPFRSSHPLPFVFPVVATTTGPFPRFVFSRGQNLRPTSVMVTGQPSLNEALSCLGLGSEKSKLVGVETYTTIVVAENHPSRWPKTRKS